MTPITHERLRKLMHYDPETGLFTRIATGVGQGARPDRVGHIANATRGNAGYEAVAVAGRSYAAHRLAWLYMTGAFPALHIDHADGDRRNNRWANLRECTVSQNIANSRARQGTASGCKGVTWCKYTDRWRAKIKKDYRCIHLGRFDSVDEAKAAYDRAAEELFGPFARAA